MRRKTAAALLLAACMAFGGCGGELSDKFEEKEVREAAAELVGLLNEGEFAVIEEEMMGAAMGEVMDQIEAGAEQVLTPVGEYEGIQAINITGTTDKDTGTPYAVAVVLAEYSDGKVQYTISFDTAMKCVGLYMK